MLGAVSLCLRDRPERPQGDALSLCRGRVTVPDLVTAGSECQFENWFDEG